MKTEAITIRVAPEVAKAYQSALEGDQKKIDAILSLRLKELTNNKRSLEEVMRDISQKAQARGLTPEILEDLLSES
jgi:hypothetical protein